MTCPAATFPGLPLGTAPDSWGVWFAQDPQQVGWKQYLDDVANAGYVWTELGPQGFLPQDPQQLRDELDQRGLKVCGGTVFAGLHKGKEALDKAIAEFSQEAKLLTEVGAKYLIHLPEQYTDMHTGEALESADMDPEQWSNLISGTNELGRVLYEEFGVELVFHPHADTHVDTQDRIEEFLNDTDPQFVNLCLDTGHIAYCGGDNLQIIERAPERITYVHFKLVDPKVRERVRREKLSLAEAVPLGNHGRAPVRGTSGAATAGRASRAGPGPLHRHRAGPVPDRCRTCRWPSRPGRPGTSPPWAWARSGAGRTECVERFFPNSLSGKAIHVTVNVGVIGVGMIGQDHIRRLTYVLSGARVTAVTDVDLDRAKSAVERAARSARCMRPGRTSSPIPGVDAIIVASWGPTHEEYVLAGIAAGKQVFCEKPLATTREACERILDAEVAAGRRLVMVGFMRRYDDGYRAMKEALDRGDIGAPLVFHSAHRNPAVPPSVTTDGVIVDTCVHDIDIARLASWVRRSSPPRCSIRVAAAWPPSSCRTR